MSEVVYINCAKNSKVKEKKVVISDVATVWCKDKSKASRIKNEKLFQVPDVKKGRYCMDITEVFEVIYKIYPDVQVESTGESEFIIEYVSKKPSIPWEWTKAIGVGIVTFIGSVYAIMAYNNDVGMREIFDRVYEIFTGAQQGVLEVCFSIGIFLGIIIFYNHAGKLRLTDDPTPLEVQMRSYENQVDEAILKNNDRGPH